ncbi:MAG: hypothetical protein QOJ79_2139 [Actinomycetota bacterium]|jgi:hypothetical protein|nr:hypothetical protein [Actinomycetota bacterium]
MSPDWDGLALGGIRRAARTTAGSAVLLVVLATNPFGSRDWIVQTAADQAQRKADRAMHAVLDQYEKNLPGYVAPPEHDQATPSPTPRRHP